MSSLALTPHGARGASGGPDAYGYIWVDSRAPSPTFPYKWVDILGVGAKLALPDDGCTYEVSLGFQFKYYGTIGNTIFICSNGFITFETPDSFYADPPIPDPAPPNNRVVGFGWDLNPADPSSGGVYIYSSAATTPKRFIITWSNVVTGSPQPQPPVAETFQIILEQNETTKDGRIILQYQKVTALPGAPLVGIENKSGSSGLAYTPTLANNLAVAFLPPSDQGLPPDVLHVTPAALAPPTVPQGTANVGMLRVDLYTNSNYVDVTRVRVNVTGTGTLAKDVPSARLWLDDGDGIFEPLLGQDTLLARADVAGTPPSFDFQLPNPVRVATGSPVRLFVSYNIDSLANPGNYVGAKLFNASSISVVYPDTVDPTGLPFDTFIPGTRTQIVASQDTLRLTTSRALGPAQAAQWETDVPALQVTFDVDHNYVTIASLRVDLGWNASTTDVWAVKLFLDVNGDGNYTPGQDSLLGVVAPTTSPWPPHATFPINLTIASGARRNLTVVFDVAPNAVVGHALDLTVNWSGIALPAGAVDLVSLGNFPAQSGVINITAGTRPALDLPWSVSGPDADGVWQQGEYMIGPANTVPLDRPIGNLVPGYLTAQNNRTHLYVAIDAPQDTVVDPVEQVAIAFDTDGNGAPTPGADDLFVVNATSAQWMRYNGTAGTWTTVAPCTRDDGNASLPHCATGIGVTAFRAVPHRFYEFSIPLSLLGVAVPIVPGASIRFALAASPYCGLRDGGNRSTWPLLFCPPLADYGDLLFATGFVPNRPPSLNWTGEPGYTSDAVDPDVGLSNATFEWRILYSDPDNDPPGVGQPWLHLSRDGAELPDSPYTMVPLKTKGVDYKTGAIYLYRLTDLPCGGSYTYQITVVDARGLGNETPVVPGPQVVCPNLPPVLSAPSVSPLVDVAGRAFTYRVAYADLENETPVDVHVFVLQGGAEVANGTMHFENWLGAIGDFVAGARFASDPILLANPGFNYSYRFHAADANGSVDSEAFFGPYVQVPPPHILSVAGVDQGPLECDVGQKMVPLLNLWFFATVGDVNITSIHVDRTGTGSDTEAERIVLYEDLDQNGALSGGDMFLGARPPLGVNHAATFLTSLRVPKDRSVSILLFVNVSQTVTADDTLGVEVANATYITVTGGNVIQAFPTQRSTKCLINVAPDASNLAVNGFADGTPGVRHIRAGSPPVLSWHYGDANAADVVQQGYDVSVSSVTPPSVLWRVNASGSAGSIVYGNSPPLVRGASYLLQVSVFDGRLWSAPVAVLFRVNTPPPAPTPFAPPDGATGVPANTTLLWNPVSDADFDPITYLYWISDDVGFANATAGRATSPGANVSLAKGTTYYWKVAASDGWEVAGNTTVWQFTTAKLIIPIRGIVYGRILNGTLPLAGAVVLLFGNGSFAGATVSAANGTFYLRNLDLETFAVRVEADGFKPRTLAATPTEANPVVNVGDVPLEPVTTIVVPPDNRTEGLPTWALLTIVGLVAALLGLSLLAVILVFRRRREEEPARKGPAAPKPTAGKSTAKADRKRARAEARRERAGAAAQKERDRAEVQRGRQAAVAAKAAAKAAAKSSPIAAAMSVGSSAPAKPKDVESPPNPGATRAAAAPAALPASTPPEAEAFECPVCGRRVAADATRCLCGAVFEA